MGKLSEPSSVYSWENTRHKALEKIRKAAGNDEILEEIAEETDPKKKQEREKNCEVIHMVVSKCVDNYRDGEYDFPTTINMLCAALKKVK